MSHSSPDPCFAAVQIMESVSVRLNTVIDYIEKDRAGTPALLNLQEVVKYLKTPKGTILHWIRLEKMPFVKLGKHIQFKRADLDAWILMHTHGPQVRARQRAA